MGSNTLFFYGTLCHPSILSRVIHGAGNPTFTPSSSYTRSTPALLPQHRRHRVRGADYPAVVPHPAGAVRGTLVAHLTDMDVRRLDIFEGDEYERRDVRVRLLDGGEERAAQTYIWIAPGERLEDGEWDFDTFVREKMRFWLGGETGREEFGAVDEAVRQQDGTGGRSLDGDIGRELEREHGGEAIRSAV